MSMMAWFSRYWGSSATAGRDRAAGAHGARKSAARGGALRPLVTPSAAHAAGNTGLSAAATEIKSERSARREQIYTVVRDTMMRAGVLSASYKFKVLSLDQRGLQYLVMVDMAREYGGDTSRLSTAEQMLIDSARTRFQLLVKAVYWRINEQVTGPGDSARAPFFTHAAPLAPSPLTATPGAPASPFAPPASRLRRPAAAGAAGTHAPAGSRGVAGHATTAPAPLLPPQQRALADTVPAGLAQTVPAALAASQRNAAPRPGESAARGRATASAAAHASAAAPTAASYDPIEQDEIAAFRQALHQPASAATRRKPRHAAEARAETGLGLFKGKPVPGFEDTELPDTLGETTGPAGLSETQYGDLR